MTSEQVAELRVLLAQARVRPLTSAEHRRYVAACTELQDSLIHAQLLLAPKCAKVRRAYRAVRELRVELKVSGRASRGLTRDFSIGGFSAWLTEPPPTGVPLDFSLWLSGARRPLKGTTSCRGCRRTADGRWRAAFQFVEVNQTDHGRLEREVVETALEMLWPSGLLAS
ncbi:MAG: PilZ domain-containing protein [Deltaproteobacteria bacterium]|nr:PilZ domain-containing protein [Deltaproteobacteria bacterium]